MPDSEDLREALASALNRISAESLTEPVQRLIGAYRGGEHAEVPLLASDLDAAAYAAYRMPATHAAVLGALGHVRRVAPELRPRSQLDVGGGTGAAVWAATASFAGLTRATVLDQVPEALALGRRLARGTTRPALRDAAWQQWQTRGPAGALPAADLVTVSYLLGELPPQERQPLVRRAAAAAGELVLVVEPGTPAGYERVLEARSALVQHGLAILAPCPHEWSCPMAGTRDWCHFAARVNRSALHRRLKEGQLGYEDEKYSYVAAAATGHLARPASGRIVRHPVFRKGIVSLQVCSRDDGLGPRLVSKRQGPAYRQARDAEWGDAWPPASDPPDGR